MQRPWFTGISSQSEKVSEAHLLLTLRRYLLGDKAGECYFQACIRKRSDKPNTAY